MNKNETIQFIVLRVCMYVCAVFKNWLEIGQW